MSDQSFLTQKDIDRLTTDTADAIQAAAIQARLRAGTAGEKPLLRGGAGSGAKMPPLPSILLWPKIIDRWGEEANRNKDAFAKFSTTITAMGGSALIGQVQSMIQQGKESSGVIKDIQDRIGPNAPAGHKTLQIGVVSGGKLIIGGGGVTGVAIPLHAGSKLKWFSGAEVAVGLAVELESALMFGGKLAFPTELKGEFWGAHGGIHMGAGFGLNIFFSADEHLKYEGFSMSLGVGLGGGLAILAGFELVTSD